MSGTEVQVLVVVQEALLAGAVSRALTDAGYSVHWAANGEGALEMAHHRAYAVFVAELVLPDMLGMQLVHSLRAWGRRAPVLMLAGRHVPEICSSNQDPTLSVLPKPFMIDDLVRRVRAMAGSPAGAEPPCPLLQPDLPAEIPGNLVYQRLQVDPDTRAASREGRSVALTEREFALLGCLMRTPEEVVTRAELSRAVWGTEESSRSNVLEVYINFLRRKIDQGFEGKLLHTVRGVGYVLRAEM